MNTEEKTENRILIESMTRIEHGQFTIRCWRQEDNGYSKDVAAVTQTDIRRVLNEKFKAMDSKTRPEEIAQELLSIDRMNAVEVLFNSGNGCCFYKNWP